MSIARHPRSSSAIPRFRQRSRRTPARRSSPATTSVSCWNGDKIFPALIETIRSARTSITYAQYCFEEGPVADEVVAALAERCRAGMPAHVLLDGVGTVSMPSQHVDALKAARCDVKTFRALRP